MVPKWPKIDHQKSRLSAENVAFFIPGRPVPTQAVSPYPGKKSLPHAPGSGLEVNHGAAVSHYQVITFASLPGRARRHAPKKGGAARSSASASSVSDWMISSTMPLTVPLTMPSKVLSPVWVQGLSRTWPCPPGTKSTQSRTHVVPDFLSWSEYAPGGGLCRSPKTGGRDRRPPSPPVLGARRRAPRARSDCVQSVFRSERGSEQSGH